MLADYLHGPVQRAVINLVQNSKVSVVSGDPENCVPYYPVRFVFSLFLLYLMGQNLEIVERCPVNLNLNFEERLLMTLKV